MRSAWLLLSCVFGVPLAIACASVSVPDEGGSGGSISTGGRVGVGGTGTGGFRPSVGGSFSIGGTPNGGAPSGGALGLGGEMVGVGGSGLVGGCRGKPTMGEWRQAGGQNSGDQVVHQCTKIQSTCASLRLGIDYLFECTSNHVPNCTSQLPEDGNSWTVVGTCDELGVGGMGGASD